MGDEGVLGEAFAFVLCWIWALLLKAQMRNHAFVFSTSIQILNAVGSNSLLWGGSHGQIEWDLDVIPCSVDVNVVCSTGRLRESRNARSLPPLSMLLNNPAAAFTGDNRGKNREVDVISNKSVSTSQLYGTKRRVYCEPKHGL
jgi:hypothetical protein